MGNSREEGSADASEYVVVDLENWVVEEELDTSPFLYNLWFSIFSYHK